MTSLPSTSSFSADIQITSRHASTRLTCSSAPTSGTSYRPNIVMRKRSSVKTTAPVRSCSCWAYVLLPAQGSPEIKWAVDILIGIECYTTDGNGDSSRRFADRVRLDDSQYGGRRRSA